MKFRGFVIPALVGALAACGSSSDVDETGATERAKPVPVTDFSRVTPSARDEDDGDADECRSALAEPYIGQDAGAQTRGQLLSAVVPVTDVRWIGPDDIVTEDNVADRLNITLDEDDVIIAATCG